MIHALKETAGETMAVSEDEIVAALKRLARLGLFAEPTSACAAAALAKLIEQKVINARERTVVLISGTGIKTASMIAEIFEQP
jgi:threonine synthase